MRKTKKIVAVSGGFDPIQIGHVHLFRDARALGDKLLVILNNDEWLMRHKGRVTMPQNERKELLESIRWVDEVVISDPHEARDISHMLEKLDIDIFANGGSAYGDEEALPEAEVCKTRGIKMVFNIGDEDKS